MNDLNPPAAELGLTSMDMGIKQPEPAKTQLAQANGRFYNSLIDTYLSKENGENKQQQLAHLVEGLPSPARGLYDKGIQAFEGELQENHTLLEQHRGDEAKYLLSCVMKSEGKSQEQIDEVLGHITPEQARFVEPIPGVAIVQVEHELYGYLSGAEVITGDSEAIHFGSDTREEPSFMVVRRHRLSKGLDEEGISPAQNNTVRHEFHHFVWNFLERGKFVREAQDASPELSKAFGNFRNELAAYVIEGRPLTDVDSYAMTYTQDRDILKQAGDTKAFAYVCMEIARSRGVDMQSFLYPAMTSRNFAELRGNLLDLTPVDEQVSVETVNAIYDMWGKKGAVLDSIHEVLREKNATIPPDMMREVALKRLNNPRFWGEFPHLRDLQYTADDFAQFSLTLGADGLSANDLLTQSLSGKLPIPDETIQDVLNLPRQVREEIPVTNNPEKFIRSFVSLWKIDDDARRAAYAQMVSATPEMRAIFESMRDEIMAQDEKSIKQEYGYEGGDEEKRQKIDKEVQRKRELLLSL